MNDDISARIRRIIAGTANTIVAKIEGLAPEMILEQAIREVDDAVDQVRAELGQATAEQHHVRKAMAKLNEEHSTLEKQVQSALPSGRKDLIEAAVTRQVDIEDQLPALESQLRRTGEQIAELNQAVTGLIAKRNEMEEELFAYRSTRKQAEGAAAAESGVPYGSARIKAEKAGSAFARVMQDATGVRSADMRTTIEERAKLVELAQLSRRAKIEAKLKSLEG
jgi:phage shock protein A